MKRRTGTFTATGDDGRIYTIHVYTDFSDAGHHGDPSATIPGIKELQTSEGSPVNYKEKGVYQLVATGVILRCIAPSAP
jgi:hypothetical protein